MLLLHEDDRKCNWGDWTDTHRWTLGSDSAWQPVGSRKPLETKEDIRGHV